MNITNSQLKRIKTALINTTNKDYISDALKVFDELEARRAKENAKYAKYIAKKRANDPLYGRSDEYKRQRIAKARKIIELYGYDASTFFQE